MTVKNFTHSTQRLYIVLLLGEQWRDRCSGEQKTLSLGQTAVRACLDNFRNLLISLLLGWHFCITARMSFYVFLLICIR